MRPLPTCEAMDDTPGIAVQIEVVAVERVVGGTKCDVGLDAAPRPDPFVDLLASQQTRRAAGEERVAVARAQRDRRHLLAQPRYVGDDLQPDVGLCTAADGDDALHIRAELGQRLHVVPHAAGHAFEDRTEHVVTRVREAQAGDHAARHCIVERCPLAAEVRQADQAAGSRGDPCGRFEQRACVALRQVARQVVLEPARDAASRAHAGSEVELPGIGARDRPHTFVRRRLALHEDEEGRAAVHDHQVAGAHDAHADRFAQRIDRPDRHRRADGQARRFGTGPRDGPCDVVAPAGRRQHRHRRDVLRVALVPLPGARVVQGHVVARGVAVDAMLAAQAPDQVRARRGQAARAAPHLRLVSAEPADLRTDGLAGEAHQRKTLDLVVADQRVEGFDFRGGTDVHAVEDAGPQRVAHLVQRQQAGADGTHRERRDVRAAKRRAVEHLLAQGAQVVPPNAVGILLDMARRGSRDAVRHDGRAQDLARGRDQRGLAAVGADVDAEQQGLHASLRSGGFAHQNARRRPFYNAGATRTTAATRPADGADAVRYARSPIRRLVAARSTFLEGTP